MMLNPVVVAAIRVVGVRGDPCGAIFKLFSNFNEVQTYSLKMIC